MPVDNSNLFSYKAVNNKSGRSVYGKIEAPNELAVEQMLSGSDLTLITATRIKRSKFLDSLNFFGRITNKDMITLFISLEQLQKAGVPLMDTLKDLKNYTEKPKLKDVLQGVYESVKNGDLLSTAMSKYPKVFPELVVSLVAMGERTGNLDIAFKNIYENMKWTNDIKKKTTKAVKGPLFSLGFLLIVTTVLLKVVVPKVLGFILEQEIDIPSYTLALIATSNFLEKYFFMIVAGIVGFVFFLKFLAKTNKQFKIWLDKVKTMMPIIGGVIQKIELSKFSKFFGITFSSGIHVLDCLTIANNVVQNAYIKDEIEMIKQKVSDGKTVGKAISECERFPFIVIRMFKVGEESGNIENAMGNIGYFYDSEINDSIDNMVASLKPLIMFLMGGLLCWVIASVFGPIYGNFSNMV
jgi:type IV pilus assembly protein PilC